MEEQIYWMDTALQVLGAVITIVVAAVGARKGWMYHLLAKVAANAVQTVAEAYVDKVKAANLAQTGSHKLDPVQAADAVSLAEKMIAGEARIIDENKINPLQPKLAPIVENREVVQQAIEREVKKLAQRRGARGGAR